MPQRTRNRTRAWLARIAAVTAFAAAGTLLAPGAAHAATYNKACGAGYGVIDTLKIGSQGAAYLTYNTATGKNCVVTVRNKAGSAIFMNAWIGLAGASSGQQDDGHFTEYAGPVYLAAKDKCIDWGGDIGGDGAQQLKSHCS
jgi:hypothetical protein